MSEGRVKDRGLKKKVNKSYLLSKRGKGQRKEVMGVGWGEKHWQLNSGKIYLEMRRVDIAH